MVEAGAAAVSRLKIAGRIGGFLKKLFGKADGGAGKVDEVAEAVSATTQSAKGIEDALEGLPTGRSRGVRTVNSSSELDDQFVEMTTGGKPLKGTTYPGQLVELPDGTTWEGEPPRIRVGQLLTSSCLTEHFARYMSINEYTRLHRRHPSTRFRRLDPSRRNCFGSSDHWGCTR